ncbi:hypothetical protein NE237_013737 [Protea cynaroides]|uniref:Uncharacterized protein n=1 Tax=Protea cynaroides TaxID=273540 RepID=A0A9Q0H0H4_9MAGN|nr:hypothetical protein NE237_013737 [Protea cynaroides]
MFAQLASVLAQSKSVSAPLVFMYAPLRFMNTLLTSVFVESTFASTSLEFICPVNIPPHRHVSTQSTSLLATLWRRTIIFHTVMITPVNDMEKTYAKSTNMNAQL